MSADEGAVPARGRRCKRRPRAAPSALLLGVSCGLFAPAGGCAPDLIVGVWQSASGSGGSAGTGGSGGGGVGQAGGDGGGLAAGEGGTGECEASFVTEDPDVTPPVLTPVTPWSTGFENDFCDYALARGFCYAIGDASFEGVTAPVHSGTRAAAFVVNAEADSAQTRCVREGTFPRDAYYGAWFYLAGGAESAGNWNLMYFNGGTDAPLRGLWDVSLDVDDGGRLSLYVYDQRTDTRLSPANPPEVPVGAWFHVEFRLRRAADATGLFALYQDGTKILEASGIATDDSIWGQWYVGNYGDGRVPPSSTVYVDDVSLRVEP